MRIEKKIDCKKQGFGVTRKDQAKEKNRYKHRREQLPDRQVEFPFQQAINRKPNDAANAVIYGPDGDEVIAGFPFVRVSAARTTIEWGKPIAQSPHSFPRNENRADPACRTAQTHGAAEITKGSGRCARLFHSFRIRRQPCGAKAGLFILSEVEADDNTGEFSRYAKYDPNRGSVGR